MNYAFLLVPVMFYVFPIKPTVFPFIGEVVFLLTVFYAVVTRTRIFSHFILSTHCLFLIGCVLVLMFLSASSILYNRSDDLTVLMVLGNYLASLVIGAAVVLIFHVKFGGEYAEKLIAALAICAALVGLSAIAEFLSPAMSSFFNSHFAAGGNINYEESFRAKGFVFSGGSSLSFALAICAGLALVLANRRGSLLFMLMSLAAIASTFVIGRTGLVISLVLIGFTFLQSLRDRRYKQVFWSALLLAILVVFLISFVSNGSKEQFDILYSYSLEFIKSYIETGSFQTASTTDTLSMYFWPEDEHWLTGAGFFRYPVHGYGLSDVGYVKAIFSYGILGALVQYSAFLYMAIFIFRRLSASQGSLILFGILASYWVVEFKAPVFIQNAAARVLVLLFFAAICKSWQDSWEKHNTIWFAGIRNREAVGGAS